MSVSNTATARTPFERRFLEDLAQHRMVEGIKGDVDDDYWITRIRDWCDDAAARAAAAVLIEGPCFNLDHVQVFTWTEGEEAAGAGKGKTPNEALREKLS